MASPAKDGESSRTQSTFSVPAQSEVYEPATVVSKDEGYMPSITVSTSPSESTVIAPETLPEEAEKEGIFIKGGSKTSPESSNVSPSSSIASSTPDQEHVFQGVSNYVGELEARIHTTVRTSRVVFLSESESESDELRYGEMNTEEHSHGETSRPPNTEEVKTAQELSKKFLKEIVANVYHIYRSRNHQQLSDATVAFVMVVEAIRKVMCIANQKDAECETKIHIRWFLEAFNDKKPGIPDADVLSKIRNSIAHRNFYLEEGNNMKMYNQHPTQMKLTMIHTCTVGEFIELSDTMCTLFLMWEEIQEYLPNESIVETAEEEVGN